MERGAGIPGINMMGPGRRLLVLALATLVVVSLGCGRKGSETSSDNAEHPVFKLRVYKNGSVTLDSREIKLDELPVRFAEIKSKRGVLWYYREGSSEEPHPNAMVVMKAIADSKLAVSFSNQEDFSTVVLPNGVVKAR